MKILRTVNSIFNLDLQYNFSPVRYLSNKTAWVTKIKRGKYLRVYPTTLVFHNGSSVTTRYYEPRRIITLPAVLSELTEEEKLAYMERKKSKKKVVLEEEIEDDYDPNVYLKVLQKASG